MKTARIYLILALAAILPWIVACVVSGDDAVVENTPRPEVIRFRAGISPPVTRVQNATGTPGETSWSANDSIVILMDAAGANLYTYAQSIYSTTAAGGAGATGTFNFRPTGSSPATQPVFPLNNDPLSFYAYYPYDPTILLPLPPTGAAPSLVAYPIDISRQNPIGTNGVRADFMLATAGPYSLSTANGQPGPPTSPTAGVITLNFQHQLVKLVVKLVRDQARMSLWNAATATNTTATIKNAISDATVDFTAAPPTITPSPTARMDVPMRRYPNGTGLSLSDSMFFECILMPTATFTTADSLVVVIATKAYKSTLTDLFSDFFGANTALTEFEAKKKYTIHAKLMGNMLTDITGVIDPWEDGGTGSGFIYEQQP